METSMELKLLALIAMIATTAIPILVGANLANAAPKSCEERGFAPGCSPGQHVNDNGKSPKNVGNPHYPQSGGDRTGNPHGEIICTPEKGNPHATYPC